MHHLLQSMCNTDPSTNALHQYSYEYDAGTIAIAHHTSVAATNPPNHRNNQEVPRLIGHQIMHKNPQITQILIPTHAKIRIKTACKQSLARVKKIAIQYRNIK